MSDNTLPYLVSKLRGAARVLREARASGKPKGE